MFLAQRFSASSAGNFPPEGEIAIFTKTPRAGISLQFQVVLLKVWENVNVLAHNGFVKMKVLHFTYGIGDDQRLCKVRIFILFQPRKRNSANTIGTSTSKLWAEECHTSTTRKYRFEATPMHVEPWRSVGYNRAYCTGGRTGIV
jgi:hypothetical protein